MYVQIINPYFYIEMNFNILYLAGELQNNTCKAKRIVTDKKNLFYTKGIQESLTLI